MSRNVHRYRIDATVEGEIEFDQAKPETYTAALAKVAEKRVALCAAGATITLDRGGPVTVRGE